MKQLLKNLNNVVIRRAEEFDDKMCKGTSVRVYVVESDDLICKIWNSSNNSSFDKEDACREIVDRLLEDENIGEGHFSLDFNEIWFEITEK